MKQRPSNVGRIVKSLAAKPHGRLKSFVLEDEDSLEQHLLDLAKSGKLAQSAQQAISRQQKSGMPITFKRGKRIIKQFPDGHFEVLGSIEGPKYVRPKGVRVLGRK